MITTIPLEYGKYYHIYNRGINGCDVFKEIDNFKHFLKLYEKYVTLVADTYAWVLMKNHFHFLVRVKEEKEITIENLTGLPKPVRFNFLTTNRPSQQFSNLFNAYAKAFNKKYNRTGSLFERPFNRIEVTHEDYLKILVSYIHYNPVHHGFVGKIVDYPWSSYVEVVSSRITNFQCMGVIGWLFDNLDEFLEFHEQYPKNIDNLTIEKD